MRRTVLQFLEGYLNARGNAGSVLEPAEDRVVVRYRVPMGRTAELYHWGTSRQALALEPGMWLTVLGAEALASLPALPADLPRLADETLMIAELPLNARTASGPAISTMSMSGAVRAFNRIDGFAPIPEPAADRERAAFFRADRQGEPAAAARYGWAGSDLVVVDRVLTLPEHRRRGLAEALMHAMATKAAAGGATRMLLISSEQGRPLYERIGFRALAPVAVFGDLAPS